MNIRFRVLSVSIPCQVLYFPENVYKKRIPREFYVHTTAKYHYIWPESNFLILYHPSIDVENSYSIINSKKNITVSLEAKYFNLKMLHVSYAGVATS